MVAAAAFHAAYASVNASFLIVLYLFALLQLAQADRWRKAFYPGLAVGLLIAAVRLEFFWRLFSGGAVALWLVYAFWIGLFVALARLCLRRLGPRWGWLLIPFVWTGLEYFRSELYYLRFSWLNVGFAFAGAPWQAPFELDRNLRGRLPARQLRRGRRLRLAEVQNPGLGVVAPRRRRRLPRGTLERQRASRAA